MKKGIVCVYGWQNGTEEYRGTISIENNLVHIVQGKDLDYRRLTIPLTSVMMIEWENKNENS